MQIREISLQWTSDGQIIRISEGDVVARFAGVRRVDKVLKAKQINGELMPVIAVEEEYEYDPDSYNEMSVWVLSAGEDIPENSEYACTFTHEGRFFHVYTAQD